MKAPGRIFLLVTGIIYIVIGASTVLSGILMDMTGQILDGVGGMFGVQGVGTGFGILAIMSILAGAYNLVVGILGVAYRNDYLDKPKILIVIGSISLGLDIISAFALGVFSATTVVMLAIPICYIIGAVKNKKY